MKLISIILISVILVSCAAAPQITITTPKAAVAYASVLSVMQYAFPLFMACVGVLIAKRTKEFKGCDEPIAPDMVVTCDRLRETEEVRKQNTH